MKTCKERISKQFERIVWVTLKDSIFLRSLMLEYKLFSNNYCKHSKTVIKIKLANVKASTVYSLKLKNSELCHAVIHMSNKTISTPEIIIQTFDYNAYENKHFNNQKGTTGFESILCSQGISKCQ